MRGLAAAALGFICLAAITSIPVYAADVRVYFGTQQDKPGAGVSMAHFDTETGSLGAPELLLAVEGPSFFAMAQDGEHLYSTNYTGTGGASSFKVDTKTGQLKAINRISGEGAGSSHISLDGTGRFALVANFAAGHVAVFPIGPDGSLGAHTAYDFHTGSSIDPQRQSKTYPHCILTDQANRFALVPDLGLDKLFIYRLTPADGTLAANDPPFVTVKPGSGPRHVRFHPNGKWIYLINEMGSSIVGYNWDAQRGALAEFQTISSLPADFAGQSTAAEIDIHFGGRFLYASNRGDDSIAVFAIDAASGRLSLVAHVKSQGKTPRDFVFDPTGQWLLCTNQASDNAVVFRIDLSTGRLKQSGQPTTVPAPCGLLCVMVK